MIFISSETAYATFY